MKRCAAVCGILVVLAGCMSQREAAFNANDFPPSTATGTAALTGRVYFGTPGSVVYAIQNKVELVPVTPYTEEWYQKRCVQGENLAPADPRELEFVRSTTTDGKGVFGFDSLPAGDYFVSCNMTYELDAITWDAGLFCKRVHVGAGESKSVDLTK